MAALGFGSDRIRTLGFMATDISHRVIMLFLRFLGILLIFAGKEAMHEILDEFETRSYLTTYDVVSCQWASEKIPIDI